MAERAVTDERRILLAAPGATAETLGRILAAAGYQVSAVCTSGAQALALAQEQMPDVLVTTYRLGDMTGEELIVQLNALSGAVLITPQDESISEQMPEHVMVMHNPLNKDVFLQTVHVLLRMSGMMNRLRREVNRLERMLTERKITDRAKGRLMDGRGMSESDAHHYMQKMSMDSGKRLADVAREILEEQMAG